MSRTLFATGMIGILIVCLWSVMWLNPATEPEPVAGAPSTDYDVRILLHLNDRVTPAMVKDMLRQLPTVTGLQFDVWVGDNTTSGIHDAKARISLWLSEFKNYSVVIQSDYAFWEKYGYWQNPFWVFHTTETLSQQWYTNWYGNLSEVLSQYPNVKLVVGINEPYNHFPTKEMAQTIMEREYLTWKNLSSIPFTVKFSMPYLMWANYWNFPRNASIEDDLVPVWKSYSDYVGMDLWADGAPPHLSGDWSTGYNGVTETIAIAENYSALLKKPIFIGEYPAWYAPTLQYICDHVAKAPNIGQVYQLWYWTGQEDLHQDAWTYGLFNVDPVTLNVTQAEPSWSVFNQVLNPTPP